MKLALFQVVINCAGVLLLLLSSLLPLAAASSRLIFVSDSNVLQQYLCGKNDQQVPNNTVLILISPLYELNASDLCLVSNRHNIGIVSFSNRSVISCATKSGLGFVNVNVLNITNVVIQSCGAAILPVLTDRIGATTGPYLPNTSYASLAIVDSSAVSLSWVTITSYYGYAILAVNVYGVSKLSNMEISYRYVSDKNTSTFNGSGAMIYYHNSSNQASLSISKSKFTYNQLFSSACLPEVLAPLSHNIPIQTPYASALSVVYNQVSQNVSVTIANCLIDQNTGSPVMLILYFDSLPNVTTVIDGTNIDNVQIKCTSVNPSTCRGTGLAMHIW